MSHISIKMFAVSSIKPSLFPKELHTCSQMTPGYHQDAYHTAWFNSWTLMNFLKVWDFVQIDKLHQLWWALQSLKVDFITLDDGSRDLRILGAPLSLQCLIRSRRGSWCVSVVRGSRMWCPHDIGRDSWVWGEQETLCKTDSPHEVGEEALSKRSPLSGESVPWNGLRWLLLLLL